MKPQPQAPYQQLSSSNWSSAPACEFFSLAFDFHHQAQTHPLDYKCDERLDVVANCGVETMPNKFEAFWCY